MRFSIAPHGAMSVLDQCAGSGTIFLAADKVGRVAYGLEIEPRYVDVAILRWQQLTKLEATLDGDGRTFEEIKRARARSKDPPEPVCPILQSVNPDRNSGRTAGRLLVPMAEL